MEHLRQCGDPPSALAPLQASNTHDICYNKSYTALRWNVTAAARGVPGAVRLTLAAADSASAALEPIRATQYAWWFRYKYTGVTSSGVARLVARVRGGEGCLCEPIRNRIEC